VHKVIDAVVTNFIEIEEIKKPSLEVFCDGFFKFFICIYLNLLKEYKI